MKSINKAYETFHKYRFIFEIIFVLSLYAASYYKLGGFYFETNDDHLLEDIMSGNLTGSIDNHTIYNGVLYPSIVSFLYNVIPTLPWHGIVLMLLHVLLILVPLDVATSVMKNWWSYIFTIMGFSSCFLFSFYTNNLFQYTSTSMLLATAGYLCLILTGLQKGSFIWFAVFEVLAYSLRPNSMEIIQPLGCAVLVGLFLCKNRLSKNSLRKALLHVFMPIGTSLAIIFIGIVSYNLLYSGDEWKFALKENDARSYLMDYSGFPEYEEVSDILDEKGVSFEEYDGYYGAYIAYDWDTQKGTLAAISEYAKLKEESFSFESLLNIFKWVYFDSYREDTKGILTINLYLIVFILLVIVASRRFKYFIPLLCYYASKAISWGYVYYKGRMPSRVMFPLYQTEAYLLLAILFLLAIEVKNDLNSTFGLSLKKVLNGIVTVVIAAMLFFYSYKAGKLQYYAVTYTIQANSMLELNNTLINEYTSGNSENCYIISDSVYGYFRRSIFYVPPKSNYILSGSWYSSSPSAYLYSKKYVNMDKQLYFITSVDEGLIRKLNVELAYFEAKYNMKPEVCDTIISPTGGEYLVYRIR